MAAPQKKTKRARAQDTPTKRKFALALASFTLLLIFGYFIQVFLEIRQQSPVAIAVERIKAGKQDTSP